MIIIDGTKFEAKIVPKRKIVSIWKTLTEKPFPRLTVFRLEDSDFDRAMKMMKCAEDKRREVEEWGRVLSAGGTDACVFNVDGSSNVDFVILVRENPYHPLREVLKHEFSHVVRGDL